MHYTNRELVERAKTQARLAGLPKPRTAEDVERLTGFAYVGPTPSSIGRTYSVPVKTWSTK